MALRPSGRRDPREPLRGLDTCAYCSREPCADARRALVILAATQVALVGALGGGVLFFALAPAGVLKVVRSHDDPGKIWLPRMFAAAPVPVVVLGVGVVEIVLACWIVLAPSRISYAVVALSLGLMTGYGLASLAATGQCSCGGVLHATTYPSLLARNAVFIAISSVLIVSSTRPTLLQSMFGVLVSTVIGFGVVGGIERVRATRPGPQAARAETEGDSLTREQHETAHAQL